MKIKNSHQWTIRACCIAYITQAIAVNFAPLLFLKFHSDYGISMAQIGSLVAITFIIQIAVDFFSAGFVDKIGYRRSAVAAHIMAGLGFVMLGVLPDVLPNSLVGIYVSCFFYSFGSGLIEVIVSPIVESCPTDNKESAMGFLHSFYCWGTAIVIFVSTIFFIFFGIENWRIMSMLWAVVPVLNIWLFTKVPIASIEPEENGRILGLLRHRIIWVIVLMMIASGAAELSMSQWASAFAESGLGVSKAIGDMAGPFMFAVFMGVGRVVYSVLVKKISMMKYMAICGALCIIAYLMTSFAQNPIISLTGCAMVGFSVGVFWPGTFSYATQRCRQGGTAMFGLLAFSGDMGCSLGPALVGFVSGVFGDNLSAGLFASTIFPVFLLIIAMVLLKKEVK